MVENEEEVCKLFASSNTDDNTIHTNSDKMICSCLCYPVVQQQTKLLAVLQEQVSKLEARLMELNSVVVDQLQFQQQKYNQVRDCMDDVRETEEIITNDLQTVHQHQPQLTTTINTTVLNPVSRQTPNILKRSSRSAAFPSSSSSSTATTTTTTLVSYDPNSSYLDRLGQIHKLQLSGKNYSCPSKGCVYKSPVQTLLMAHYDRAHLDKSLQHCKYCNQILKLDDVAGDGIKKSLCRHKMTNCPSFNTLKQHRSSGAHAPRLKNTFKDSLGVVHVVKETFGYYSCPAVACPSRLAQLHQVKLHYDSTHIANQTTAADPSSSSSSSSTADKCGYCGQTVQLNEATALFKHLQSCRAAGAGTARQNI